ncbi:hypothetical protein ANANG_G00005240 [Anguilla anguilla]|uniref:Uncharacterized protein n=1 Tax=Anguilla anguilla TaxID=7936 RepID=A0A9D3MVR9_ANGAN|nr:hypothetical protein ANANG_G00005240 [Anguilla anguilla]
MTAVNTLSTVPARTQQVEQFGVVTVGEDRLYSIPSARAHHQGTYQCEIFSQQRSIVRTYHHLKVIPQVLVAQAELQGVFDTALLPGGRFRPRLPGRPVTSPRPRRLPTCRSSRPLLSWLPV